MILRHRDTEVLRFDWVEPSGVHVISVNAAAERFQPLEFRGEPSDENVWKWLTRRLVPRNRAHVQDLLLKLGYDPHDIRGIIGLCRGLSLNDVHWVVEDDFRGTWSKYNLYDNAFSSTIAQMAFTGGGSYGRPEWSSSPEFTTNGMLAKCWRRQKGVVTLYKSGTEGAVNAGFEPYSEYYAAQVAAALGLPHVDYGLSKFKGRLCSTCPLFTSERYGFIPAGRLTDVNTALKDPRFSEIFFFDALIFNTDRHMGNFGYLIDNDTNEIVGAAPVFDNGYGLFSLAVYKDGKGNEFDDLRKFTSRVHPSLYTPWLAFPGAESIDWPTRLAKLKGFRFKQHDNFNLPTERLRIIEDFLQKRIREIEQFGLKADECLKIADRNDTITGKNVDGDALTHGTADRLSVMRVILESMNADPFVTIDELVEQVGLSRPTVQRYVRALRIAGAVERKGARKTGSWSVDLVAFEANFGQVKGNGRKPSVR